MVRNNECHLVSTQRPKRMGKAHPGVELGVPGEPFFQPWHPHQDHPKTPLIIEIPELFQTGHLETVGFVHDEQFGAVWALPRLRIILHFRWRRVVQGVLHQGGELETEVAYGRRNPAWRVRDRW